MTNHTPCLLDEAATFMKVQYLSDLRFLSTNGRSRLAAFLETFDAAEYTLFQWNDAIEYLKAGGETADRAGGSFTTPTRP